MSKELQCRFAEWLSSATWKWTTYGTLTFSRPMRKDALRFARAWVRNIARTAAAVRGFCFQETHSDGQRLHVHCLLSVRRNLLGQPSNEAMWRWWFQRFGRAVITDFRATERPPAASGSPQTNQLAFDQLSSYLTKYVVKEASAGGFDWDFYSFADGKEMDAGPNVAYNGAHREPDGGQPWVSSAVYSRQ